MFKDIVYFIAYVILFNVVAISFLIDSEDVKAQSITLPDAVPLYSPTLDIPDEELHCLAENIYHEARDQGVEGMQAVAFVTLNRVDHVNYPDSICGVVYDKNQFSWTTGAPVIDSDNVIERRAWETALTIAYDVFSGKVDNTFYGVTHYHATYVSPEWSTAALAHTQVGDHIFYSMN